jgi:CheY-like chemotaxis protein
MKIETLNSPLLYAFSRLYHDIKSKRNRLTRTLVLLSAFTGSKSLSILIADDDAEDREIFTEAIHDVAPQVSIDIATNGQQLMQMLTMEDAPLPQIIFLDLNMPLKNGHECLEEIRSNKRLKHIPVIIYSTSTSREHIDETFRRGASFYMPKPDSFHDLKLLAKKVFSLDWNNPIIPRKEKFVLSIAPFK